jgi:MarR family transcriptional regulator, temperature-dependent positive regulator of motility
LKYKYTGVGSVGSEKQVSGRMSGNKENKFQSRSVSHLMKRAVQFATHLYMAEAGKSGLTQRQFIVLQAVDAQEGQSQTDIVKITGIDRSTLADLVSRLMEQGYLQRRRSKDDARTNTVKLTPVGLKALKGVRQGADEVDKLMLSRFSASDRKVFLSCLTEMADEMDHLDNDVPEKPAAKIKLKRKTT